MLMVRERIRGRMAVDGGRILEKEVVLSGEDSKEKKRVENVGIGRGKPIKERYQTNMEIVIWDEQLPYQCTGDRKWRKQEGEEEWRERRSEEK
jgi:hypothetical protein